MMRFTVLWDKDVEEAYLSHWIEGDSRKRAILTELANGVDSQLAENPENKGQLHSDLNVRILAVPVASSPIRVSVSFKVSSKDRCVNVIRLTLRGEW